VAEALKFPARKVLTGAELAELTDSALIAHVEGVDLFARVTPDQKTRIIRALQARGHTVGFIGDGVNDAPALLAGDVGISVDGATDVARSAADMIMLAQDLGVLADGVEEGRRTFSNILKYVRMGTSSNFGNMLSMALASLVRQGGQGRAFPTPRLGHERNTAVHIDHGCYVICFRSGDVRDLDPMV
jgi:Mg2+-importing ATPase